MDRAKKAVKVTKKKTEKKKVVKKKTTQIGKQVGKVKTGAVVQIDLSRRTIARKKRNTERADALQTGLLPLLMGIQSQSVASASNIERLQMERDRLRQQIQNEAVKRVDAIREGRPLQAHDAHERQRKAQTAERRTQTEINVKSAEQPLSAEMGVQVEPKKEEFMSATSTSRGTQITEPKKTLTPTKPKTIGKEEAIESRFFRLIRLKEDIEEARKKVEAKRRDLESKGEEGEVATKALEAEIRAKINNYNRDAPKRVKDEEEKKLMKKYKLPEQIDPISFAQVKKPKTQKIKISKGKGKK